MFLLSFGGSWSGLERQLFFVCQLVKAVCRSAGSSAVRVLET